VFLTSVKHTDDQSVNFLDIGIAQLHACVPTDLITRIALRWSVAHHGRELLGSASPDDVSLYRREFGSNLRKGLSLADRYHIMKEKFRMDLTKRPNVAFLRMVEVKSPSLRASGVWKQVGINSRPPHTVGG
jgi:hypothetical protein